MLPGRSFGISDITQILVRRGWLIVLPFAIGVSTAPLIAKFVPERYRSETLIMDVPQRVPDSYVKSTVTARIQDRLPTISNMILSRSRLERIINDFNLYPDMRAHGLMEDIVQRLRADISVQVEGPEPVTSTAAGTGSFRVKYVSTDPQTAQKVTARLASLYIEENLRDRANLADETNLFLESQLADAKQRLIEHEKKLEAYRRQYAGQLPSQLESNLQTIKNTQLQLQAVVDAINRSGERRLLIERQIADIESLPPDAPVPSASGAQPDKSPAPVSAAQQLENAEAQLKQMRLRYTADHPDVRAMERAIRDLRVRAAEEAQRPADRTPDAVPVVEPPPSPAQLARKQRLQDLRAELDVIDHQLAVNQAEETRLKEMTSNYQAKIDIVPTRESELAELTRDYGTLQTTYTTLLTKREDSKVAANLERQQIGEQFRILDPASLPERPYNELQRIGIIAAGAGVGLILGLLTVALLEIRESGLKREEDVVRVLSLPVLAMIPQMLSTREVRARRLRAMAGNVAAAAALLASIAIIAFWQLHT